MWWSGRNTGRHHIGYDWIMNVTRWDGNSNTVADSETWWNLSSSYERLDNSNHHSCWTPKLTRCSTATSSTTNSSNHTNTYNHNHNNNINLFLRHHHITFHNKNKDTMTEKMEPASISDWGRRGWSTSRLFPWEYATRG